MHVSHAKTSCCAVVASFTVVSEVAPARRENGKKRVKKIPKESRNEPGDVPVVVPVKERRAP